MKNRNYIGEFASWQDVHSNYQGDCPAKEPRYVFADYQVPGYEGYSTVITSSDAAEFAVVEGSHCSCFGLEDQWKPTLHGIADLNKMMEATYGFFDDNKVPLKEWLAHID